MSRCRAFAEALLRLSLALILAVSSVHLVVMRGAGGDAVAWLEICDGGGVALLAVDGTGAPVPSHPSCPDCVIVAAVTLPAGPDWTRPVTATLQLATSTRELAEPPVPAVEDSARGPPLLA